MATSMEVEDIPSGGDTETELSMSLTGLSDEDFQSPERSQLQQLIVLLPSEHNLRHFLENFCLFTTHIRDKLTPAACNLDLATDTHLVGLEETLAITVRTYMNHPQDSELHKANAEQTVGQIQRSLKAIRKTHPNAYKDLLDYINTCPAMKGRDRAKTKKLLKQLFIGNNPKTALISLMDFTAGPQEAHTNPVTAGRPQSTSVNTQTTATTTSPCEEFEKSDPNTGSYAVLAALLGGIGIAAIGVGIAIACTGVGGPLGCGASIAGATLLLAAGVVACGAGITSGGVASGKALKRTKKGAAVTEDEAVEEHEEVEGMGIAQALEIPPHRDPLIRSTDKLQHGETALLSTISSVGTTASSRSYNPHNWPVIQNE